MFLSMNVSFGNIVSQARNDQGFTLIELSAATKLDPAIISKIEKGHRLATVTQFDKLVKALSLDDQSVRASWLADRILDEVGYDMVSLEALRVAEERIKYNKRSRQKSAKGFSSVVAEKLEIVSALQKNWGSLKPLDELQLQKMREFIQIKYTYHSIKIEGNTLTLQETQLVINEGIMISGKSVQEHLEAINHAEAINYLYDIVNERTGISEKVIKDLHYLVLKTINPKYAGKYRDVPVRITGSEHVPCQPYLIRKSMEEVMAFYEENKAVLHPVILAAEMHERLVSVHPFLDGNGRTSRLLMNVILLMNGYTIANIKGDDRHRMRYYRALESCREGNKEEFFSFILDTVIESLEDHLSMV